MCIKGQTNHGNPKVKFLQKSNVLLFFSLWIFHKRTTQFVTKKFHFCLFCVACTLGLSPNLKKSPNPSSLPKLIVNRENGSSWCTWIVRAKFSFSFKKKEGISNSLKHGFPQLKAKIYKYFLKIFCHYL